MRSDHKSASITLIVFAIAALAQAGEKSSIQPWPYGLYDKNIQRQESCTTNRVAERPLKVLYYHFDDEALRTLERLTNKPSIDTSPRPKTETTRTNSVKSAKPNTAK